MAVAAVCSCGLPCLFDCKYHMLSPKKYQGLRNNDMQEFVRSKIDATRSVCIKSVTKDPRAAGKQAL